MGTSGRPRKRHAHATVAPPTAEEELRDLVQRNGCGPARGRDEPVHVEVVEPEDRRRGHRGEGPAEALHSIVQQEREGHDEAARAASHEGAAAPGARHAGREIAIPRRACSPSRQEELEERA